MSPVRLEDTAAFWRRRYEEELLVSSRSIKLYFQMESEHRAMRYLAAGAVLLSAVFITCVSFWLAR